MTQVRDNLDIRKFTAIALIAVLLPVAAMNLQVNAQSQTAEEDPYTPVVGAMEIHREVVDGSMHITKIFSSDDVKNKYGVKKMVKEDVIPLDDNYSGPSNEIETVANVKMEVIHENEKVKLDKHQKTKNNGIPMYTHEQWSLVKDKDKTDDTNSNSENRISSNSRLSIVEPQTHVQNWAHKQVGSTYVKYDPINVIWADTQNASTDVLNTAVGRMNGNGWGQTSVCLISSDLYILIGSTWTKQTAHEYKYIVGWCDQYHVRMWRLSADSAIGAAHKEHWHGFDQFDIRHIGGWNVWEDNVTPGHVVDSWEGAETEVRNAFTGGGTSCWSIWSNNHSMGNSYTREYWNTARTQLHNSATSNSLASSINQILC